MGAIKVASEHRVKPDLETRVMKPESFYFVKCSGVKPLNWVLELLLRATEALLRAKKA